MSKTKPLVSIICPVYNEEGSIPIFFRRLESVISPLSVKYDFELLFTNNCSTDSTYRIIADLCEDYPWVKMLTLSRNFGYQSSLLCGLHHVSGDYTIIIDVDCEDPPEMIPSFIAEAERGYDVVYGCRHKRPESIFIQLARKIFYRMTRMVADYDFVLDMAEFSLFSRRVRVAILQNKSTFPFIRAEIGFVGFRRKGIVYTREHRVSGKTHYNFFRMAQFAIGGILSSSTFFLRLAVYLGFPLAFFNLILGGASLMSLDGHVKDLLFFINWSFTVFFLAVLATYMARIHKDNIGRPLFIVDWDRSIYNDNDRSPRPSNVTRDAPL